MAAVTLGGLLFSAYLGVGLALHVLTKSRRSTSAGERAIEMTGEVAK